MGSSEHLTEAEETRNPQNTLYSAVDQCFSVARCNGIQAPTVPKMQVLQHATNKATSVAGRTSGRKTWRMPTEFAFPNQARSSSLMPPPPASVSEILRLRSCARTQ